LTKDQADTLKSIYAGHSGNSINFVVNCLTQMQLQNEFDNVTSQITNDLLTLASEYPSIKANGEIKYYLNPYGTNWQTSLDEIHENALTSSQVPEEEVLRNTANRDFYDYIKLVRAWEHQKPPKRVSPSYLC
jgi:hypothetical protein